MSTVNDLFAVQDGIDSVLLGCFFFGLLFSALSLVLGAADLGIGHHVDHSGGHAGEHGDVSPFNVGTILAFLTWFGGVAYLMRNALDLPTLLALMIGLAAGVAGGWLVFRSLRALKASGQSRRLEGARVVGSLGRVSSGIRAGGTGEVMYELGGVRQVTAARAANGAAIPRGTEVVIMRRDSGIAVVETWLEIIADQHEESVLTSSSAQVVHVGGSDAIPELEPDVNGRS